MGWKERRMKYLPSGYVEMDEGLLRDITWEVHVPPSFPAEKLRRLFGIQRTFSKRLNKDLLMHCMEVGEKRMIGVRLPGNTIDVKVLNYLNMLSSDISSDINEDVAYVAEETGKQYFLHFGEVVGKIYGEAYLIR